MSPAPTPGSAPSEAAQELETLLTPQADTGNQGGDPPASKSEPAAAAKPADKKDPPADEDPEIDFGEGFGKMKRSQARDLLNKGNDYSKKTEELNQRAQSVKQFEELSQSLAQNPKKLQAVLKILEAKEDAAEAQAAADAGTGTQKKADEAANAAKNAIQAALEKLDPDDPGALILKHMVGEMGQLKEVLLGFKSREEQIRQQEEAAQKTQQEQQQQWAQQLGPAGRRPRPGPMGTGPRPQPGRSAERGESAGRRA